MNCEKMFDIAGMGELLVDFVPDGTSPCQFCGNAGGAPANVLAIASRLGGKCAFIGKVGDDSFGRYLSQTLDDNGIDIGGMVFDKTKNTTITFVSLDEHGNRNFSFYRDNGADTMITPDEINYKTIENSSIFHFGSLSMTNEPARSATKSALNFAVKKNKIISYDPNFREPLWKSKSEAMETMSYPLEYVDILKLSEYELPLLTGENDLEKGTEILMKKGIDIVTVTLGAQGCYFRCRDGKGLLPTYDTTVVDTTGSGDCFFGSLLLNLAQSGARPESVTVSQLEKMVDFSNAAGALCATKHGAIPAMPDREAILHCMAVTPKL